MTRNSLSTDSEYMITRESSFTGAFATESPDFTQNSIAVDFGSHAVSLKLGHHIWLGTLLVFSVYLSISYTIYVVRKNNTSCKTNNLLCMISCIVLLARTCWVYVAEAVQPTKMFCTAQTALDVVLANGTTAAISYVLWMRQHYFYSRPTLSYLSSRKLKVLSRSILLVLLVMPLVQTCFLLALPMTANSHRCLSVAPSQVMRFLLPCVYMLNGISHLVLLALVLYPILRHIQTSKNIHKDSLESVVVRLSVATAVCVASDVSFILVAAFKRNNYAFSFLTICYCYNTLINILALSCSFSDWQARLAPFLSHTNSSPSLSLSANRVVVRPPTTKTSDLPI